MGKKPRVAPPGERHASIRSALRQALSEELLTARELSARVGISEKDVADHLEHVARSLRQSGERLRVEPAECLGCGFVFKERARLSRPSRCPECRSQRLVPSRFAIAPRHESAG